MLPVPPQAARTRVVDWAVLAVGAIGALIRVAYVLEAGDDPTIAHPILDCAILDIVARELAQGGDPWGGALTRPPLYPYMLAQVYAWTGGSIFAARVVQAVLGGITCALTVVLGRRLFDRRVAVAGGLIVACYGPLVFFDERLLASCVIVLCYLLALLAAVRAADKPVWYNWLLCGLAIGVAALARPTVGPFFVVVLLVWLLVTAIRRRSWLKHVLAACCLVVGCVLPIVPVTLRNYAACGEFVPISYLGGINLFIGNNPNSAETIAVRPGPEWDRLTRLPHAEGMVTPAQAERFFTRRVADYVWNQPGRFLLGLASKARLFCNSREMPRVLDPYLHRRYSNVLGVLVWRVGSFCFPFGVLLPLGVLGMCVGLRSAPQRVLAIGFAVAVAASVVLFFNASRYRLAMVPVLGLFAAWAVVWLGRQAALQQWRAFGLGVAAVLVMGVAVNAPVRAPSDRINYEAELYEELGRRLWLAEGDADGSEAAFLKALELAPESAEAYANASQITRRRGKVDLAIQYGRQGVALDGRSAVAHVALGEAYLQADSLDAAVAALQGAVAADPTWPEAHAVLGKALETAGRHAEALEHYRKAVHFQIYSLSYRLSVARALTKLRRYDEAVASLEGDIQQMGGHPDMLDELAWLLATCPDDDVRDCERARDLVERAITEGDPHSPVYRDTYAAALACEGQDWPAAVRSAEQAAVLARKRGLETLATDIEARAELYRRGQPCRNPIR